MELPADLEQQILNMPGVTVNGQPVQQAKPRRKSPCRPTLDSPWVRVECETFRAMIPVASTTEVNVRNWKNRSRRTDAAWKAVSKTLGANLGMLAPFAAAYHHGKRLRIVLTRWGGRKCDRSNLPSATKGVEDALAFMMGADDGDARWQVSFQQQPGKLAGVLIEIGVMP